MYLRTSGPGVKAAAYKKAVWDTFDLTTEAE